MSGNGAYINEEICYKCGEFEYNTLIYIKYKLNGTIKGKERKGIN